KPRRWQCRDGPELLPLPALGNSTLPRKGVRALLHRPTKLFLIPAISIWKTSLVSATLLCNKLLQNRFHLFLAFWEMFENVIPKTPQQKGPFDQRRTIKNRQRAGSDGWGAPHIPTSQARSAANPSA